MVKRRRKADNAAGDLFGFEHDHTVLMAEPAAFVLTGEAGFVIRGQKPRLIIDNTREAA